MVQVQYILKAVGLVTRQCENVIIYSVCPTRYNLLSFILIYSVLFCILVYCNLFCIYHLYILPYSVYILYLFYIYVITSPSTERQYAVQWFPLFTTVREGIEPGPTVNTSRLCVSCHPGRKYNMTANSTDSN